MLSPEDISISAAPTSVKFYSKYTITDAILNNRETFLDKLLKMT